MSTALPKELYDELGSSIRGDIYARNEPGYDASSLIIHVSLAHFLRRFEDYSTIFNGNVKSTSKIVAVPLDASDISK